MAKAVQKIEKVMPKSPRNTSCHMYGRGQFNFGKQFNPPIGFAGCFSASGFRAFS